MFTGIIETLATVTKIVKDHSNVHITLSCKFNDELKVDQSVSHDGVCLTVVDCDGSGYTVTAIGETLKRSCLSDWKAGHLVNVERCMPANGRFDGHIVQGHVDTTGVCKDVRDLNGSWEFIFSHEKDPNHVTVEKGSITVNGVSLTVVRSREDEFSVHIIPYTFDHTNFKTIKAGSRVNLEFDIVGKYVARLLNKK